MGQSLIPSSDYVVIAASTPPEDPERAGDAVYDEKSGMWHTTVFPSQHPSSRRDVELLEQWLEKADCRAREVERLFLEIERICNAEKNDFK